MENYILGVIIAEGSNELYIRDEKNDGRFVRGHVPWNKGKSWDEMGISKDCQLKMCKNLEAYMGKGNPNIGGSNARPVIAIDEYGNKVHWYKSAADAARKLGIVRRNITRAIAKDYYCGDYRWRYDNRFNKD